MNDKEMETLLLLTKSYETLEPLRSQTGYIPSNIPLKNFKDDDFFFTKEVASFCNEDELSPFKGKRKITQKQVTNWIRSGKLKAVKPNLFWYISKKSILDSFENQ